MKAMDKFKFRAWNKEWDEMLYSTMEHDWFGKREFAPWMFDVGFSTYPKEDWEFMLAMEKTDKNGKTIYEGDILRVVIEFRKDESDDEPEYRTVTGEVCFHGDGFWFTGSGYTFNSWHFHNSVNLEVIGNIYENPDLLEYDNKPIRGMGQQANAKRVFSDNPASPLKKKIDEASGKVICDYHPEIGDLRLLRDLCLAWYEAGLNDAQIKVGKMHE